MDDFFSYAGAAEPPPATTAESPRAILAGLDSDDWEKFIGFAARRRYPPGAVIVDAGATGPGLGFIASGEVEVRDAGSADAVRSAGAARTRRSEGEVFGMLSFLDGAPSSATISVGAAAPAELLLLSPAALAQLAAWQPRIAVALLRDLGADVAARLRRLQPAD